MFHLPRLNKVRVLPLDDQIAPYDMTPPLRQAIDLLDAKTRRRMPLLIASFALVAAFDALSIGLVFPLVLALVDGDSFERITWLAWIASMLGTTDQRSLVMALAIAIGLLFVVKNIASAALVGWQYKILFDAEAEVGVRLYMRYLTMPWRQLAGRNSSELIRNASTSASHAFLSFMIPGLTILVEGVLSVAVLVMLLLVDPLVAVVSFALVGLAGAGYYLVVRRGLARVGSDFQLASYNLLNQLKQGIGAGRELRVLGRTDDFVRQMREARTLYSGAQARRNFLTQLPRYYLESVLVVVVIAAVALAMTTRAIADIAPLMALFGVAALRLMTSASRILASVQQVRIGVEPLAVVHADLFEPLSPEALQPAGVSPRSNASGLHLDGVHFAYLPDRAALRGIDLHIATGTSIGIVGPSGSGKSTLIDIVLGLLRPNAGSITVNGTDIHADLSAWRRTIGYVPQSIYLTDDTLRRNVAFGLADSDIDDEAVRKALKLAELEAFAATLPSGIDTVIGEQGASLSGGQRQRIGIARALYHDPSVLLMDEATSALDSETENTIVEAIDALRANKTVIVVAHRLSTVRRCDVLVMMEAGSIVATGSFESLLESSAAFARMVRLSAGSGSDLP